MLDHEVFFFMFLVDKWVIYMVFLGKGGGYNYHLQTLC